MTVTRKPQYKTERVLKDDGTVVNICRCALSDLDTLLEIQDRLVEAYVKCDTAIGEIISSPEVQADLKSICAILPLEQKAKGEVQYLDYEDIKENWEQLIALFFNGDLNPDTRSFKEIDASRVAKLHFLPYAKMVAKHLDEARKERAAEAEKS